MDILHFSKPLHDVDMEQTLGPDSDRRYLAVRKVDVTPTATTVTLRGILPDEFRERAMAGVAKQREFARIRALFIR